MGKSDTLYTRWCKNMEKTRKKRDNLINKLRNCPISDVLKLSGESNILLKEDEENNLLYKQIEEAREL